MVTPSKRFPKFDPVLLREAAQDIRAALASGKAVSGQDQVLTSLERNGLGGFAVGVQVATKENSKFLNNIENSNVNSEF